MTHIANGFSDRRNTSTNNTYPVSLLPAWLLDNNSGTSEHCVMTDVSSNGAAILVPRSQATNADSFELVFMSPDNEGEILVTLPAEQRWRDEQHSPEHIKLGVAFLEMNIIKAQVINAMIEIFNLKSAMTRPGNSNQQISSAANAEN